jgi:hypothetical protein
MGVRRGRQGALAPPSLAGQKFNVSTLPLFSLRPNSKNIVERKMFVKFNFLVNF